MKKDIISEEDFNEEIDANLLSPEEDSPGDSDDIMAQEYMLGVNHMPEGDDEDESDDDDRVKELPTEEPSEARFTTDEGNRIPENAKVVHSGAPQPLADLDAPSDTH